MQTCVPGKPGNRGKSPGSQQTTLVMARLDPRLSGLISEPYQGVILERRVRAAYRGSMSKHVPVSLWIPGNRKGDFGNDGEDECKKNEPDRRGLDRAIQEQKTHIFQCDLDGRVNPRVKPEGMARP